MVIMHARMEYTAILVNACVWMSEEERREWEGRCRGGRAEVRGAEGGGAADTVREGRY